MPEGQVNQTTVYNVFYLFIKYESDTYYTLNLVKHITSKSRQNTLFLHQPQGPVNAKK